MSNDSPLEKLVIGTRGSPLALAQANEVRNKILSFNNFDPANVALFDDDIGENGSSVVNFKLLPEGE